MIQSFTAEVIILMDTTYLGHEFGVMVFEVTIIGQILWKQYVSKKRINYT